MHILGGPRAQLDGPPPRCGPRSRGRPRPRGARGRPPPRGRARAPDPEGTVVRRPRGGGRRDAGLPRARRPVDARGAARDPHCDRVARRGRPSAALARRRRPCRGTRDLVGARGALARRPRPARDGRRRALARADRRALPPALPAHPRAGLQPGHEPAARHRPPAARALLGGRQPLGPPDSRRGARAAAAHPPDPGPSRGLAPPVGFGRAQRNWPLAASWSATATSGCCVARRRPWTAPPGTRSPRRCPTSPRAPGRPWSPFGGRAGGRRRPAPCSRPDGRCRA